MRPTPVFGDPKTDFVFQRIFGTEDHKTALIGFLNDILQLDGEHRVTSVMLLPPEQRPKISELKYSIVDVKCVDARGTTYVVEMQVLNVAAFEKRVVYNVAKAYVNQLGAGFEFPELDDVIGISICDFELWPRKEGSRVPMLSRWRMQEQTSGVTGLSDVQLVFLELPKYEGGDSPQTLVDKWVYFFREAGTLMAVPEALRHPPLLDAFEGARTARFNRGEWDMYIASGMALRSELGALSLARREGEQTGELRGELRGKLVAKRETLLLLCARAGITFTDHERARIEACEHAETLDRWIVNVMGAKSGADVFA
jgi:predicted transposase/invertase (TIGR01784 family)